MKNLILQLLIPIKYQGRCQIFWIAKNAKSFIFQVFNSYLKVDPGKSIETQMILKVVPDGFGS